MFQWTYSDYVTYAQGADRLSRLRLHIKEVIDAIYLPINQSGGNGHSYGREQLQGYLKDLKSEEKTLASSVESSTTQRSTVFTTGVFRQP